MHLRVLFVTDRWDAPYRYRCVHGCEQLRAVGDVANVRHVDDGRLLEDLPRYGVVVLFRLPWSARAEALVERAHSVGCSVVFDIDDLVFDEALHDTLPFRGRFSTEQWRESYGGQAAALRRTMSRASLVVASTPAIAEHARALGMPSAVHENLVPARYLRLGGLLRPFRPRLRRAPTLGYFAGSNTHDEDLASIDGALVRVFERLPAARLIVGGFVEPSPALARYADRIDRLPYLDWRDYPLFFTACHACLAPHALRSTFADAKSALKFFEAGAMDTPVVATPVAEMARAIEHGRTGLLAETEDEWAEAMLSALDEATSSRLGRAAREAVERHHSPDAARGRLHEVLAPIANTGRGPAPTQTRLDRNDGAPTLVALATRPARLTRAMRHLLSVGRAEPTPRLDHRAAERWVTRARSGAAPLRAGASGAVVLVRDDESRFEPSAALRRAGALRGETQVAGPGASASTEPLSVDPRRLDLLMLRVRAVADGPRVRLALFWRGRHEPFTEDRGVRLSIAADGADHTLVVDLAHERPRTWARRTPVHQIRLDPADRPASVRISLLALAPREALASASAEPVAPADLPTVDVGASIDSGATILERTLGGITAPIAVRVTSRLSVAALRETLAAALPHAGVVVRDVVDVAGGGDAEGSRGAARHAEAVLDVDPRLRRGVDVVVPVYGALPAALRCLSSVVRHRTGDAQVIIVDDASPGDAAAPALQRFAAEHAGVEYLCNAENIGFVRSCNVGFEVAGDRDVLLLNSDTETFAGFLDGLRDAAYDRADAGIACPLSNNATILSVPKFCEDNRVPEGLTGAEMAALVARTSRRAHPELVTPHGFCMYVRRDCLEDVGLFDAERFGRGFGEENDFGERAKRAGWVTVAADDVYVWHQGSASFGADAAALQREHAPVLERAHPGYHAAVSRFVSENPLREVHADLAAHLERAPTAETPAPLMLLHASPFAETPGGVEHCVRDLVRASRLPRSVLAYPSAEGIEVAEVFDGRLERARRYGFELGRPVSRFAAHHDEAVRTLDRILDLFRVGAVHVHHLMYWPRDVARLLRDRELPYLVTAHDYYLACPSFNLLRLDTGRPCCPDSAGDATATRACMVALHDHLAEPLAGDPVDLVAEHRRDMRALLGGARVVTFPSEETRRLVGALLGLGDVRAEVLPHGYDLPAPRRRATEGDAAPRTRAGASHVEADAPLRVAIVGAVAHASKGRDVVLDVMGRCRGAPIEWHVFGRTDQLGFDAKLDAAEAPVVRHGSYDRASIVRQIAGADCDAGLLMPTWPETFSYTLSEMVAAGLVVVARDIGALGERVRAGLPGVLVDDAEGAAAALRRLAGHPGELARRRAEARRYAHPSTELWAARFRQHYDEALAESAHAAHDPLTRDELQTLNRARRAGGSDEPRDVAITRPDERLAASWWYPCAERLKPHVPESVRAVVRRRLARDGLRAVQRFPIPGPRATLGPELDLDQRYFGTARLTAHGTDPQIRIAVDPFEPETVDAIRFNLWCSTPGRAHAQIYFRHEGEEGFSEERSVEVPLDGRSGQWQEYVVRISAGAAADTWHGGRIVELRFDPIDVPGPVCIGELALCAEASGRKA